MKYNPSVIEKKWQRRWSELNSFKAKIDYKKPVSKDKPKTVKANAKTS